MTSKMKHGSRLQQVESSKDSLHWLWVPGGPGLDSSYLAQLAKSLRLPGNAWTLDLPRQEDYGQIPAWPEIFGGWRDDLKEVLTKLENVVLVGHSFGGMLALSTAGAEKLCRAAVFLDSCPNGGWIQTIPKALALVDPQANADAEKAWAEKPSDHAFAGLFDVRVAAYFRPEARDMGKRLLREMRYNHFPFIGFWQFAESYKCEWKDWSFPTLALSGDSDMITPLVHFATDPLFSSKPNFQAQAIAKAGHFPWVEQPKEFAKAMQAFAAKL